MSGSAAGSPVDAKWRLRERLLAARSARSTSQREAVAQALAWHLLAEPVVARAGSVAAYRSMAAEPGTQPLLAELLARGTRVLVPVVDEHGLDWVRHDPDDPTERSSIGVEEPSGPRLGRAALLEVDVVIVPALAVDHAGRRLGRGAAYYDRALGEVRAPVVALVHADELLPEVPAEPHDVPVTMAATESGIFRVP
ncbi:5-formyltetrahydrofolate cyclo-ligase [Aeromicrobium sp. CF4.19]|uniref:5-formyltetrahydrofolate cyclo-ligase n=1 Tax=Aeromicrobium sp. CF4.19 TaxID=3373082 RepID=UPI003EE4D375